MYPDFLKDNSERRTSAMVFLFLGCLLLSFVPFFLSYLTGVIIYSQWNVTKWEQGALFHEVGMFTLMFEPIFAFIIFRFFRPKRKRRRK